MAQVSKKRLSKKTWKQFWMTFIICFKKTNNQEETEALLSGLLTETEQVMLAKRLIISLLVLSNWSCTEIAEELNLSPATVYKIKAYTDYDTEYQNLLKKLFPKKIKPLTKNLSKKRGTWIFELLDDIVVGRHKRSRLYHGRPY